MAHRVQPTFKIGDTVSILSLNAIGTVSAVLSEHSYRVSVGSLQVSVREHDLRPSRAPSKTPTSYDRQRCNVVVSNSLKRKNATTIDLHGLTVDAACRALEGWLNALILSGTRQGKVIHGLGSGKVQRATHETLRRYSSVRAFRLNDLNPGETDVYLE